MHCFPGQTAVIEQDGHVGHGVTLHGCRVGRGALVGINAVVLDGAVVGERAFVGAQSLVTANTVVRERWLYTGTPARAVRALTEDEMNWKANGTKVYQELARQTLAGLREVEPLTRPEPDRPAPGMAAQAAVPLRAYRGEG
jgi:phenylacetic acid degradation protein